MSDPKLPPPLVDGLLKLCQGDFAHRLPRTGARDQEDTIAFFVVDKLSEALLAVAAGNFAVQVERDFSGDSADVLAFLVNNTVTELGIFVAEAQRKADEERARLEKLVAERTAALELLATTDVLTGALNRRRFLELADQELARAARYRHPLCLAMLDLDHFKSGLKRADAALYEAKRAGRNRLVVA